MTSDVKVCVIPAAGKGSRWAPVSGYLPKEMLPLVERPVIEWVVSEAAAGGFKEVIIVLNKQKNAIKKYLQKNVEVNKKVKLSFVYQEKPLGIAHALFILRHIIGDRPFGMALPDLPTISRKPVIGQLVKAFQSLGGKAHITSFNIFPENCRHFYSECLLEKYEKKQLLKLIHFCPKTKNSQKPHHPLNKLRMSGRYVFNPSIFKSLENLMENAVNSEITDVDGLKAVMKDNQEVVGFAIEGHTYDTGNPASYIRANTAFFKKRLAKNS
ncbi:NTP transferase domain-containing protein [Candidatus Daviesbacteria bacterium]|nr:NTP transferase domain-containing protein [Candidatus Daviesbacteria bacterium]